MASARFAFRSSISLPPYARTAGRGLRLKIYPRPTTLSDSRNILRVLQKYGHLVTYHFLRFDPTSRAQNTVIALYKDQTEAERLLAASPLQLEMGTWGVREASRLPNGHPVPSAPAEVSGGLVSASPASKEYLVVVERSIANLFAQQQRQHYSAAFEPDQNSIMYEDLASRVPIPAMADCQLEKGEVPLRVRIKRLEAEQTEMRGAFRESLWQTWKRPSGG